jgi:hypothetical protein
MTDMDSGRGRQATGTGAGFYTNSRRIPVFGDSPVPRMARDPAPEPIRQTLGYASEPGCGTAAPGFVRLEEGHGDRPADLYPTA